MPKNNLLAYLHTSLESHIMRFAFLVLNLLAAWPLLAQKPGVVVFGTIRDFSTRNSLPFPTVQITEPMSATVVQITTTGLGTYEVELTEEKVYLITYSGLRKVTKSVQIDTRGPNTKEWDGGFGMNIDISLLDSLPGVDFSALEAPFGQARWNKGSSSFQWDLAYMRKLKPQHKRLMKAYQVAYRNR